MISRIRTFVRILLDRITRVDQLDARVLAALGELDSTVYPRQRSIERAIALLEIRAAEQQRQLDDLDHRRGTTIANVETDADRATRRGRDGAAARAPHAPATP